MGGKGGSWEGMVDGEGEGKDCVGRDLGVWAGFRRGW